MKNHLIEFEKMEWVNAGVGVRYKAYVNGNQRIRMVEFSYGFIETDWCLRGHAGYVLDGTFELNFNGNKERFVSGDIFFIPSGEIGKHKAVLDVGEKVTLLLFELI
ncbi:MAG: hypothetical protein VB118_03960 [Oscillospiraceae bacterium]|nr:hypothetical protein [Oscillospiraceae bacterium]